MGNNPDQLLATGETGIVASGDPSAAANRAGRDKTPKDKKIPNDKRQTTPYMTKYERARILGTRALQIRSVQLLRWLTGEEGVLTCAALQYECSSSGRFRGRDRSATDCHQGVERKEDTLDRSEIYA